MTGYDDRAASHRRLSHSELGLLLSLAGMPAQGEVPAGRVSEATRLQIENRDPVRGRDIPGFAVNPADPRHVVLITEEFITGQCDFHTSFDGGRTWSNEGHLTVPTDFAQPPCVTYDSGGYAHFNKSVVWGTGQNVYTTFASHRGAKQRPETGTAAGEGDSVLVNRSTDGGRTWERAVVAIQGARDSRPFIIRPGIAVQPRPQGDKLYVVGWYVVNPLNMGAQGGQGDRRAVVASSEDGGRTWSAPVEAQAPDEKVREITPPVVGKDGSVYIAWRNRDDPAAAPHPIVVAKSSDGGVTWTRTPIQDATVAPPTAPPPTGNAGFPKMAVDPNSGTLYVTYLGFNFGDLDALVQRSTDNGATWSQPVRVNDDPRGNGIRQLTPDISVAPNGRVDVVWFDTRTNLPSPVIPRPAGQGDVYYASSTDGGVTFSSNRRISDRSINLDDGTLGPQRHLHLVGPGLGAPGERLGAVRVGRRPLRQRRHRRQRRPPGHPAPWRAGPCADHRAAQGQPGQPVGGGVPDGLPRRRRADRVGLHLQAGRRAQGRRRRRLGRCGAGPGQPRPPPRGRREVADQGAEGRDRTARHRRACT